MKIEELAEELEIKPTYLYKRWTSIVERYAGYGIVLAKRGRGKTADYGIKSWTDAEVRWEKK